MKPKFVHCKNFPPKGYKAITLFPFVFYRGTYPTEITIRHETCHFYQAIGLGVVLFYILYGVFYVVNLIRHRNHNKAYMEIPFEVSAYNVEMDAIEHKDTSIKVMMYNWIKCIR